VPSRRDVSNLAAMAKKRDTDDFKRIRQSDPKPRWDDDEPDPEASTYTFAEKGPEPVPSWVITSDESRQYERGVLKTGKEADVHLVERRMGDDVNVLAAKRYRAFEDRMFRNDARYRSGRRTGESRLDRAIARGNRAGMAFRAQQWVHTEFDALCRLWSLGAPVPYPVQKLGNELMLELITEDDVAAPRLVHAKPDRDLARELWAQLVGALHVMVRAGIVHGDLSPYNTLVRDGRLVIIDFPQAVDPIGNPDGLDLLARDVATMCRWFAKRGVECDESELTADLLSEVL
jgi:RIO kinase 1